MKKADEGRKIPKVRTRALTEGGIRILCTSVLIW